ncbi:YciI family protein [Streptococcus gallolyticus]|uniref:YciI family protein n=1 Tax=Streptococcus gallolyticus TaxID=315405 RepID=UPI0034A24EDE
MYLIDITIKADQVPADKADELLAGHRAWFSAQAQAGNFLLVGPYRDKAMAGLVIAQANSRAELDDLVAKDAYYPDMATYDIHEFQANIIAENITDYREK